MKLLLLLIFIFGFIVRIYGFNWDSGFHLHPDERMITMVAEKINFPSSLNPHFFAYGSFPIYLLRLFSSSYQSMNLIGRLVSAGFDSLLIIIIYKICLISFRKKSIAILSSAVYTISVLPVQLSHFYAVDTILNFFIYFVLWQLLKYSQHHSFKSLITISLGFALALATKISAVLLIIPVSFTLLKSPKKLLFVSLLTLLLFLIFQPFTLLDFATFKSQIIEQSRMTNNAFIFPYTLQYVFSTPYLYPLKNIFLWGFGPIFTILSLFGIYKFFPKKLIKSSFSIVFIFFIVYFFVTGKFSTKFMRYYLPLYPTLSIFTGYFIYHLYSQIKLLRWKISLIFLSFIFQLFWLFSFLSIYSRPNTRVTASQWINDNIPTGSLILREHWDDGLPIFGSEKYRIFDLPLYDSDLLPNKWPQINQKLDQGDYLIVASNRLYTPLSRLTDCPILPKDKCYTITAAYYRDLFSGKLGYQKIIEFSSAPQLFGILIDDQSADESFTVYDHPKVIIFKKIIKDIR